jgi:hypothetical protein
MRFDWLHLISVLTPIGSAICYFIRIRYIVVFFLTVFCYDTQNLFLNQTAHRHTQLCRVDKEIYEQIGHERLMRSGLTSVCRAFRIHSKLNAKILANIQLFYFLNSSFKKINVYGSNKINYKEYVYGFLVLRETMRYLKND